MMTSHGDDPLDDIARVGMQAGMIGSRVVESALRSKQDRTWRETNLSAQRAAEMRQRYEAEAAVAEKYLAAVTKDRSWIERADVDEVVGAWRTAAEWSRLEPDRFEGYARSLTEGLEQTYRVNVRSTDSQGRDDLAQAERDVLAQLEQARGERSRGEHAASEAEELRAEQAGLEGAATRAETAQEEAELRHEAGRAGEDAAAMERTRDGADDRAADLEYDSEHRRAATDRAMAQAGVPADQARAYSTADRLNGTDPKLAARSEARRQSRARKLTGPRKQRDRSRSR